MALPPPKSPGSSAPNVDIGRGFRFVGKSILALIVIYIFVFSVLVIVPPGYVGVDYTAWGGVRMESIRTPGWSFKLPIVQKVYQVKTARDTLNMFYDTMDECRYDDTCTDVSLQVPSKEGLLITLDVSVLYSVQPQMAPSVVEKLTTDYKMGTLVPEIRSVAREVTGTMSITEMYGTGRERLQTEITEKLSALFKSDGFVLDQVLVRDIEYPDQIRAAIEEKQAAEQLSFKKQFEIDIALKEAERNEIEGEGIAKAKIAVAKGEAESLRLVSSAISNNPSVLKFKQIEVLQTLYANPNTKFVALPSNQLILPTDLGLETK